MACRIMMIESCITYKMSKLSLANATKKKSTSSITKNDDTNRCIICNINFNSSWSVEARESHVSMCIETSFCPVCNTNISAMTATESQSHVNACLDSSSSSSLAYHPCALCGENLPANDIKAQVRHVKICNKQFNLRPADVITVVPSEDEEEKSSLIEESSSSTIAVKKRNAFDYLMTNAAKKQATAPPPPPRNNSVTAVTESKRTAPDFKKVRVKNHQYPIIVDGFQYSHKDLSQSYILTHFHSDHYGGLTSSFNAGIIYCTSITAELVALRLGVSRKYLHPLPLHTPFQLPPYSNDVLITFIDANHCPGAVLILFQMKNNYAVLHTGDFRYNGGKMKTSVLNMISKNHIDTLYLDTTYCDPLYTFPSQEAVLESVITKVKFETSFKCKTLFLFGTYSIGKEKVFMSVAKFLGKKVYVEKQKYKTLSCGVLSREDMSTYVTNVASVTNLHVVPMNRITWKALKSMTLPSPYKRVVAFRPTGWSKSLSTKSDNTHVLYSVPYSEHSSFTELKQAVADYKPTRIIPTVSLRKGFTRSNVKDRLS